MVFTEEASLILPANAGTSGMTTTTYALNRIRYETCGTDTDHFRADLELLAGLSSLDDTFHQSLGN